jgi:hypothetical protein
MMADEENQRAQEGMETPRAVTTETPQQDDTSPSPTRSESITKSRKMSYQPPMPTSRNHPEGTEAGGKWYLQRYCGSKTDSLLIPAFILFIVPGILLLMFPLDERLVYRDPGGALYDESGRQVPPGKTRPLKENAQ